MTHLISIINQKGGVGKTTTAVNLSACLAEQGFNTLLVDADPQCSASLSLGFCSKPKENTLYGLLLSDYRNIDYNKYIEKTQFKNLDIMASCKELYALDIVCSKIDKSEYLLKNRIYNLKNIYDFIVFDSPPNLGTLSLNLMAASTSLVVPLKADYLSLQGLAILIVAYRDMKTFINPGLKISGILLTMFSKAVNLSKEIEADLKKNLGEYLFETCIPQNIKIAESPSYKLPVINYDPKCSGSIKYKEFTQELLGKLNIKK
jgi:chromosome partitioning protein